MPKNSSKNLPLFKRLSYRQAKLVMIMALVIGFLFSFLQISLDYFNVQNKNEVILQQIFNSTKQPAAQAAYTFDSILAEEVVKGLFKYQPIYKIILLETSQNEKLAVLERHLSVSPWRWLSDFLFGSSKHYNIELLVQEQKYGILQVSVDTNLLAAGFLDRALVVLLSGIIRNTLLALFLLYIFHIVVTRPLFQIASTLSTIDPNNPEKTRLPCPDGHVEDELGQLVASTNKLLVSIDERTTEQESILHNLEITKNAFSRFVPREFLSLLNKENIVDVQLGDQIEKEMTVLFSDIRGFTSISEKMTPQENFSFINAYLGKMAPIIAQHQGFIDKYIGDAIMALFPTDAEEALDAAIAMLKALTNYNQLLIKDNFEPITIGIGLNTGQLMLGTVGGKNRMDGTVISNTVNLASRIEGITKLYGTALLISEYTYLCLQNISKYSIRTIDRVRVKGKSEPVTVYEVFDGNTQAVIELKMKTRNDFENGLINYRNKKFNDAIHCFKAMLNVHPEDRAAQIYLQRCQHLQEAGVPDNWDGVIALNIK
ncbi:adenylate/guanylate cyclase domain-containing protein [Candidatus Halobeggiatoa sp. HSG11]|nr:adenylate/guanylate cyclase domain-containing protein [Candidatus Halobeggiatoa sp. HSG11]